MPFTLSPFDKGSLRDQGKPCHSLRSCHLTEDTPSGPLLHLHHTVLILRLTVDQRDQLYQGVVIGPNGQTVGQFRTLLELFSLLEQWLTTKS